MSIRETNYFSKRNESTYMGSTQFKNFMKCEAGALAQVRGEWERPKTTALLVGSYVDAYFGKGLDKFKLENPEIFTKAGELKSEFRQAEAIIQRIERDKLFRAEVGGWHQVIKTGVINGVKFKIKIDSLHRDRTVDLKIMRDCADMWQDGELLPFWKAWGYDIQAAIYREIRSQNDGEVKPFRLAVATKEAEPDLQIFEFSDETLDEAYRTVYNLAPRFQAIKNGEIEAVRCGVCDYCKATKKLTKNDIRRI